MGLVVPNPGVPQDGQPVEATTLAANLNAVYQAIQSFDASQVASGTLSAGAFAASINPNTILHDTLSSFVYSGCVWTSVSGLSGTMSSGIAYIANATGMFRVSVSSVGSNTFAASRDTYIDIDYNGNVTYSAVANNATSPALAANSIRVAIVVTDGSAITFINQGQVNSSISNFAPVISGASLTVQDTNGNLIYPNSAAPRLIGYRELRASNASITSTSPIQINTAFVCPVLVPHNRKVRVTIFAQQAYCSTSDYFILIPYNVTESRWICSGLGFGTNGVQASHVPNVSGLDMPANNATTYSFYATSSSGTLTVESIDQDRPIYISVELE